MKTILIELGLVDADEWAEQVGADVYREMLLAYRAQQEVEVLSVEVDGDTFESTYYNVKLPTGSIVTGLQGFHLKGIHNYEGSDVELVQEPYPLGLGAQYVLDIQYPAFRDGMEIDHGAIELLIKQAVDEKLGSLAFTKASVMSVAYETDYSIPDPEDL